MSSNRPLLLLMLCMQVCVLSGESGARSADSLAVRVDSVQGAQPVKRDTLYLRSKLLKSRIRCDRKVVALTIDDGPLNTTPALMAFLRAENVPATFFVVMHQVNDTNIHLYSPQDTLFEFGLHSYRHPSYHKLSEQAVDEDFKLCIEAAEQFGFKTKLFRPPYGEITVPVLNNIKRYGLQGFKWDIDSKDWNKYNGRDVVKLVTGSLHPGGIILFHDRLIIPDLEKVIRAVRAEGYEFVTLSELMKIGNSYTAAHPRKPKRRALLTPKPVIPIRN